MSETLFEAVSPTVSFPDLDQKCLSFWRNERVFEETVRAAQGKKPFVFYEGPPTANGMPHPGHVLTRIMKDIFLRYRSMCGYYVPRRGGWDTHGLPVEVEVEKELGIHGRHEIEQYGVEAFTQKCIESVFRYISEWRRMTERIAFWVDLDQAYVTFHKAYVESVWWALSELFKKGLLYQDYKIVWWWPQGGTALSSGEVGQGYRTVDDPSIVVRFAVEGEDRTSFLAWTTTPWTLPSNVALAVDPKETYVTVEMADGERLILACSRKESVLGKDCKVVEERTGEQWKGTRYRPLFAYKQPENGRAYEVIAADFVTLDSGTGIVHIAPAFGEDDFRAAKEQGLGFLQLVLPDGTFAPEVTHFAGRFCKEADRDIIRHLRKTGVLFSEQVYRHEYPFCWRADQDPLIQYARRSWFIRTTQEIQRVIANNQRIHWEPEHIKEGRFGDFLRSNVDWALSRERYWGTPLPIWVNDETGKMEAVGSVAEILERNPEAFRAFDEAKAKDSSLLEDLRVHKPWIDLATWTKPGEPGVYRRVPEVIDCWFDSGAMPFAQWGYPHAEHSAQAFERAFPADFITEAVDQTRGWFYSLITISTLLFPKKELPHPYRNCVVMGLITDEKGRKLSKSKRNYVDPMDMITQHGADAVRWAFYTGSAPGQSTRFFAGAAVEALRDFLLKLWNVYSFFVTYSNIEHQTHGWKPGVGAGMTSSQRPELDRWILAELDATVREVRDNLETFRSYPAARSLQGFMDALSNWYVRRSRGRFWKTAGFLEDVDKASAYQTLYEVLVDLSRLLAPFVPFVSDIMYQNLVRRLGTSPAISVHLTEFPSPHDVRRDDTLRKEMNAVRAVVSLGQRVRTDHKLKLRQPLRKAILIVADEAERAAQRRFEEAIKEELNVHELLLETDLAEYVDIKLLPNFRVLGPRLGQKLPELKKRLAEVDGSAIYRELENQGNVRIALKEDALELTREELEVRLEARAGFAAASERGRVVLLDTKLDESLIHEGLAREVINRVQRARKDMNLEYERRIEVQYETSERLKGVFEHAQLRDLIKDQVLAVRLEPKDGNAEPIGTRHEVAIEGERFVFWVARSL